MGLAPPVTKSTFKGAANILNLDLMVPERPCNSIVLVKWREFKSSCRGSDEKFCAITVGSRKVLVEMCTFEHCGNILAALRVFIQ